MKIYLVIIALIIATSSCVTFFHKQHKNIDCCKLKPDVRCSFNCQNLYCQDSFRKKEIVQNQCCSKIGPCQAAGAKKEVTVLEGCCKNFCQSQCVKKEIVHQGPTIKNPCGISLCKKEVVQACPPLNIQCQAPTKKLIKN